MLFKVKPMACLVALRARGGVSLRAAREPDLLSEIEADTTLKTELNGTEPVNPGVPVEANT